MINIWAKGKLINDINNPHVDYCWNLHTIKARDVMPSLEEVKNLFLFADADAQLDICEIQPYKWSVLPMWQPWAQLVVIGAKKFETRSRDTKARGTILIHACKKWNAELEDLCLSSHFKGFIELYGTVKSDISLGCIIGSVDIVSTHKINFYNPESKTAEYIVNPCYFNSEIHGKIESPEYDFGDYTPGRFAWKLENPRILVEPIPFKANQGWSFYEPKQPLIFK